MNTDVLTQPQSEARRDHLLGGVREHPIATNALRRQPSSVGPARATLRECDLLVATGLDSPLVLKTQPFAENWRLVEGKRIREVEREVHANGWNLFYLVPDVDASGIARDREQAVRKALYRIFRSAAEQGVNTVEIASLKIDSLYGFHRAKVTAKLHHIQESPYLFSTYEEMRQRMLRVKPEPKPIPLTPGFTGRSYAELHAILAGRTQ